MKKKVVVREYHRGDEGEIVELLDLAFDGWPDRDLGCSKVEYWRWKYLDNPIGVNMTIVAESGGRIVGCDHGFNVNVRMGGERFVSYQDTDLAVHPDFRRMGISKEMDKYRYDVDLCGKNGIGFVYSVMDNPVVIKRDMKTGHMPFPHSLIELVRIDDVGKHLEMTSTKYPLLKRISYHLLKTSSKLRKRLPIRMDGIEVRECERFDERTSVFYNKIRDHYRFIVDRDETYLNWRYLDERAGNFVVRKAEEDGEVLGYIVLRVNRCREDYPTGWVVDLLVGPGRLDVAGALVDEAARFFDEQGVNVVRHWIFEDHPLMAVFQRLGFLDIRKKAPGVFFKRIHIGEAWNSLLDSPVDRLHFQLGDTEWI